MQRESSQSKNPIELIHFFLQENLTRTSDINVLTSSLARSTRYYEFLLIIRTRYIELNAAFIAAIEQQMELNKQFTGVRMLTPEEECESERQRILGVKVHLEIESFNFFAKTLLDRIADTFGSYFDTAHAKWGSSHTKLTKRFESICKEKNLAVKPVTLPTLLSDLSKRIVEPRDFTEHESEPRLLYISGWGADKKVRVVPNVYLPSSPDEVIRYEEKGAGDIDELLGILDQYITAMLMFFETNKDKSPIVLKPATSDPSHLSVE